MWSWYYTDKIQIVYNLRFIKIHLDIGILQIRDGCSFIRKSLLMRAWIGLNSLFIGIFYGFVHIRSFSKFNFSWLVTGSQEFCKDLGSTRVKFIRKITFILSFFFTVLYKLISESYEIKVKESQKYENHFKD